MFRVARLSPSSSPRLTAHFRFVEIFGVWLVWVCARDTVDKHRDQKTWTLTPFPITTSVQARVYSVVRSCWSGQHFVSIAKAIDRGQT